MKKSSISTDIRKNIRGIDIIRMYLGVAIFIKGIHFILTTEPLFKQIETVPFSSIWIAYFVIFAHTVGGIGMFCGFLTRFCVAVNFPVFFGAVFFVHQYEGLFSPYQGLELTLFVLCCLPVIFWEDSGKFSLDHLIRSK